MYVRLRRSSAARRAGAGRAGSGRLVVSFFDMYIPPPSFLPLTRCDACPGPHSTPVPLCVCSASHQPHRLWLRLRFRPSPPMIPSHDPSIVIDFLLLLFLFHTLPVLLSVFLPLLTLSFFLVIDVLRLSFFTAHIFTASSFFSFCLPFVLFSSYFLLFLFWFASSPLRSTVVSLAAVLCWLSLFLAEKTLGGKYIIEKKKKKTPKGLAASASVLACVFVRGKKKQFKRKLRLCWSCFAIGSSRFSCTGWYSFHSHHSFRFFSSCLLARDDAFSTFRCVCDPARARTAQHNTAHTFCTHSSAVVVVTRAVRHSSSSSSAFPCVFLLRFLVACMPLSSAPLPIFFLAWRGSNILEFFVKKEKKILMKRIPSYITSNCTDIVECFTCYPGFFKFPIIYHLKRWQTPLLRILARPRGRPRRLPRQLFLLARSSLPILPLLQRMGLLKLLLLLPLTPPSRLPRRTRKWHVPQEQQQQLEQQQRRRKPRPSGRGGRPAAARRRRP